MRPFTEIERELKLKRFLDSQMGTLYFVPQAEAGPKLMVRRFDAGVPPELVAAYAEIVKFAQLWIDERAHLARLVRVEQPVEVGADFIARKFHVYYVRTNSYLDPQNAPEAPEELQQMRTIFREETGHSDDSRDIIVERVLARSILDPNGKTYPGEHEDGSVGTQFIIVEPRLTLEDLQEWAAIARRRQ